MARKNAVVGFALLFADGCEWGGGRLRIRRPVDMEPLVALPVGAPCTAGTDLEARPTFGPRLSSATSSERSGNHDPRP